MQVMSVLLSKVMNSLVLTRGESVFAVLLCCEGGIKTATN